ncbi:MAG: DUF6132 family protein [Verrucomicrobiota bacterium]
MMMTRMILGAVLGGAIGFGCHKYIGCSSGACPLTSHPWASTLYGVLMGAVAASSL